MVQIATNTFYNREQEREAKTQERENRKETSHAKLLATFQGSSIINPESLKDKAPGKCLICRQVGFRPKSLQTMKSFLKWLATNTINWDIGQHSALGTLDPQGQVPSLPSSGSTGLKWPIPASLPVADNHHGAGAKGATGWGRNLGPLDKTTRRIVRRSSDQCWGNLVHWWKQLCLGWEKKSRIFSSLQFWDLRG